MARQVIRGGEKSLPFFKIKLDIWSLLLYFCRVWKLQIYQDTKNRHVCSVHTTLRVNPVTKVTGFCFTCPSVVPCKHRDQICETNALHSTRQYLKPSNVLCPNNWHLVYHYMVETVLSESKYYHGLMSTHLQKR